MIVLWDGRGIANDGQPYENSYARFMKMRNGKVIDGTAFYDSIAFNARELWRRDRVLGACVGRAEQPPH